MNNRNTIHEKPIETYIKEVEERAKTMPIIDLIEIKPKLSLGERIKIFFKSLKK